jgi:hypothetical protein
MLVTFAVTLVVSIVIGGICYYLSHRFISKKLNLA